MQSSFCHKEPKIRSEGFFRATASLERAVGARPQETSAGNPALRSATLRWKSRVFCRTPSWVSLGTYRTQRNPGHPGSIPDGFLSRVPTAILFPGIPLFLPRPLPGMQRGPRSDGSCGQLSTETIGGANNSRDSTPRAVRRNRSHRTRARHSSPRARHQSPFARVRRPLSILDTWCQGQAETGACASDPDAVLLFAAWTSRRS